MGDDQIWDLDCLSLTICGMCCDYSVMLNNLTAHCETNTEKTNMHISYILLESRIGQNNYLSEQFFF